MTNQSSTKSRYIPQSPFRSAGHDPNADFERVAWGTPVAMIVTFVVSLVAATAMAAALPSLPGNAPRATELQHSSELPSEWRWERAPLEFNHMFRK